jgi:hypothetical protein
VADPQLIKAILAFNGSAILSSLREENGLLYQRIVEDTQKFFAGHRAMTPAMQDW